MKVKIQETGPMSAFQQRALFMCASRYARRAMRVFPMRARERKAKDSVVQARREVCVICRSHHCKTAKEARDDGAARPLRPA